MSLHKMFGKHCLVYKLALFTVITYKTWVDLMIITLQSINKIKNKLRSGFDDLRRNMI